MALPKIPVAPAPQSALPARLLAAISEIELTPPSNTAVTPANDTRWLAGITWNPRPCDRPLSTQAVSDICDPLDSDDPEYGCEEAVSQTAFRIYDAFSAKNLQFTAAEVAAMLNERMPLMSSDAFARELIDGAAGSDMSFSSEASAPADVAFSVTVTPEYGLAVLENELARRLSGAKGYIFAPPGIIGVVAQSYGLTPQGDHWVTPIGNTVITDTGFVDAAAPDGADAAGDDEAWLYASGPVRYKSTAPKLLGTEPNEFITPSTNDILRWMEMYGILQFDPCPVTAVLVGYNTTPA